MLSAICPLSEAMYNPSTQPAAEPRQPSMGSAHRAGWLSGEGEFYMPPLASGKPCFFVKNRREAVFPKVDTP